MPPLTELLFSFQGRIRRLHFWVAGLAVGVAVGIVTGLLQFAAGAATQADASI
jgi:uncharacterized membrane protein YhaH (DUF805 family)